MSTYLFTSESVCEGHPDKICDQISDSILDACIEQDRYSRVACETLVGSGLVVLAGEITTGAHIEFQQVARDTIREIGYNDCHLGFDYRSCGIIVSIHRQSQDISRGVDKGAHSFNNIGAGDQGIMFGFACDETPELMPLPIMLAHSLTHALAKRRREKSLPWLRPDGKSQVTIEYSEDGTPLRVHSVVLSAQHDEITDQDEILQGLKGLILSTLPERLLDEKTCFYINPTGRFSIGGPAGDCGLTGRKTIVDTYGGRGHHGGGAFSGKDPTKVDRSGSYAARYVAKNIVAAHLAKTCEVQISYAIGVNHPLSIKVDAFGTSTVSEREIEKAIPKVFDLSPGGIIKTLDL
ncbi:MAG: methionine adenosyltransferase, partial [Chlamydiia bacterium]|nr:methionine adenosyltransferase [Chlamydiia bacterium]